MNVCGSRLRRRLMKMHWLRALVVLVFYPLMANLRQLSHTKQRCEEHCRSFRDESRLIQVLSTSLTSVNELRTAGYPSSAHHGGLEQLLCPSNFRDMAQIVYEWPWGHFATDATDFWKPYDAADCVEGVITVYSKIDAQFHTPLIKFLSQLGRKFILITGQGGSPATAELHSRLSRLSNFIHWFGQNGEFEHPTFSHIPVGVNCFEHGDALMKALKSSPNLHLPEKKLVLVAFSTHTHSSRKNIYDYFCTHNRFTWVTCLQKQKGRHTNSTSLADFYSILRQHMYIICPRGAGHDAHRQYEAMYLGVIPIVLSGVLSPLQREFPIHIVSHWDDVNEASLKAKWYTYSKQLSQPVVSLQREYWLAKIERVRQSVMEQNDISKRGMQC